MEFLPIFSFISLLLCLVLWQVSGEPVEDKDALLDFVSKFPPSRPLNWLRYLFRSFLHLPSFSLANWVVYCLFISQNNMIFKYGEVSLTCHDCAKTLKNKLCWGLGV